MHVVQFRSREFVHRVVDGGLEVRRAGQSVSERVGEIGQLGPRAAAVAAVVAHVPQHVVDDGPIAGDFGPQRFNQPTRRARWRHARGGRAGQQQRQ